MPKGIRPSIEPASVSRNMPPKATHAPGVAKEVGKRGTKDGSARIRTIRAKPISVAIQSSLRNREKKRVMRNILMNLYDARK